MGSENLHEPYDKLPAKTRDLHRAIVSLMEELEAVDWYQQRSDATDDKALKAVLEHNRDEEIEHAMMNLEWIRRNQPTFDRHARTYLFAKSDITAVEEATKEGGGASASSPASQSASPDDADGHGDLGIGSLRIGG